MVESLTQRFKSQRILATILLVGSVVLVIVVGILIVRQQSGELQVTNAWMRPTAAGQNGAVYMMLDNGTSESVSIISVRAEIAQMAEIHRSQLDGDVMRMEPVNTLEISAGGQTILEPAGLHVMLMNLERDFAEGDEFSVSLELALGDELIVPVRVDEGN